MNFLLKIFEETSEASSDTASEATSGFSFKEIFQNFIQWCKTMGIKFLIALLVLIVVFIMINCLAGGIRKKLRKSPKTEGVANAVYNVTKKLFHILALIVFLGYIGIDMAGISSIFASCAVAIGLALQGSLANIAGWVILVVTRPFKLGDYIDAQGVSGTVEEINLFYTHLKTPDNKVIFIPNGSLSNGVITNYSTKDLRRLDQVYTISYDDDANKAIDIINGILEKNKLVLKKPASFVRVSNYADSAVEITLRAWVKGGDYWTLHFDLLEDVKKAFDKAGITIPFNQYDININTPVMLEEKKSTKKTK